MEEDLGFSLRSGRIALCANIEYDTIAKRIYYSTLFLILIHERDVHPVHSHLIRIYVRVSGFSLYKNFLK